MSDLDAESRRYFEQWLRKRGEAFRSAVYRRWGDDGEEVLQDCLLKIHAGQTGTAAFKEIVDVERWLWTCVRFGVIARLRRKLAEALGQRDPSAGSDPSLSDLGRLQRVICDCYQTLNPYRKDTVRRYYFDGQTVEEIAVATAKGKEAVKGVLFQARRQLRECLEQKNVSYWDLLDVMLYLVIFDCENNPPTEDAP